MFYFNKIFFNIFNNVNLLLSESLQIHLAKLNKFEESCLKFQDDIVAKGDLINLHDLWIEIDRHIDVLEKLFNKNLFPEFKLSSICDDLYEKFRNSFNNMDETEKRWFILGLKNSCINNFENSGNLQKFFHNQFHYDCYHKVFSLDETLKRYFENFFLNEFIEKIESYLNKIVLLEAEHFSKIHEKFEEFQDAMMFFDDFPQFISKKTVDTDNVIKTLNKYISAFPDFYNQTEITKKEISVLLTNTMQKATANCVSKIFLLNSPFIRIFLFSNNKIEKRKIKLKKRFITNDAIFEKHFLIEKSDWKKDIQISKYQLFIGSTTLETIEMSENKFLERYHPVFLKISEMLNNTIEKLSELKPDEFQKTKITILKESRNIIKTLRNEYIPEIIDIAQKGSILSVVRNFAARIEDAIEKTDAHHLIFRYTKIIKNLAVSKSINVPLKELFNHKSDTFFKKEILEFTELMRKSNEKLTRKTGEIDKIVDYNSEAALSVMRNRPETDIEATIKAVSIAKEGLERALKLTGELSLMTQDAAKKVSTEVPIIVSKYLDALEELTFAEKIIKLNIYLVRKRTVKNIKDGFEKARGFSNKTFPELWKLGTEYIYGARKNYSKFKKITGLSHTKEELGFFYLNTLNEIEKKVSEMPYVYQRLFSYDSLPDKNFYISRPEIFAKLSEDFNYWKKGGIASTVIVAEKGTGKTTFIEIAQSEILKEHKIFKIELNKSICKNSELKEILKNGFEINEAENIEEIEEQVLSGDSKKILFIENFQNIYLRSIDGFEAIERFLLFMERTQRKVYFIVSCNLYAWNYLNLVTLSSRYFQRLIFIKGFTSQETEEMILKRHNSSGYDLVFETPHDLKVQKRIEKMKNYDDRQNFLKKLYFEKLTKLSAGNVRSSLLMWLSSVEEMTSEKVNVSSDRLTDYPFIADLPKDELFALTNLIMHDAVNVQNYSIISRTTEHESNIMLLSLYNKALLIKQNGNFYIHPFIYRDVVRVLKALNMLH